MMNAGELQATITRDVKNLTQYSIEVGKMLVEPVVETFECFDDHERQLWIVGSNGDYHLTFNERSCRYGLAFRNILKNFVSLGDYGTISDAYEALVAREE